MKAEELKAFAQAAAKNIKTQQDLNEFSQMLTKITVEAALNAELDEHLGYESMIKAMLLIAVTVTALKRFKPTKVSLH